MAVILVGILTSKPLIFIKVREGGHKQGRVAQLVLNISSSIILKGKIKIGKMAEEFLL
jgi:hypothetical protein